MLIFVYLKHSKLKLLSINVPTNFLVQNLEKYINIHELNKFPIYLKENSLHNTPNLKHKYMRITKWQQNIK